ncbi:MAG: M4 family metallopeptidase [Actinomycetes bacterium]
MISSRIAIAGSAVVATLALGATAFPGGPDSSGTGTGSAQPPAPTRGAHEAARKVAAPSPAVAQAPAANAADPVRIARDWLAANPRLSGGNEASNFRLALTQRSPVTGQTIVRFEQTQGGLPVFAGQAALVVDSARGVVAANAETTPGRVIDTIPGIGPQEAERVALEQAGRTAGRGLRIEGRSLTIYDPKLIGAPADRSPGPVWKVTVSRDGATPLRRDVLVDAKTGEVAISLNRLAAAAPGLDRRVCDARSRSGSVPCVSPARAEGGPAASVADVNYAYDHAGDTWRFFKDLAREGLDGKGSPIVSTVRYCPTTSQCPFENAYWSGKQMVYGAGYPKADDVVAHELTHGVTQHSSNLVYYYQAGAINEGISDVFGELVDLSNGKGDDSDAVRWKIGEEAPGGMIRDMANPPAKDQPDRTGSSLYDADLAFTDDGGVHANSGIVNKTAFLISQGGTFNGRTVIGIDPAGEPTNVRKSSLIWYQASQLLTSGADFQQLGEVLRSVCRGMAGKGDISGEDCDQVDAAVAATELAITPNAAPIAKAPVCTSGAPVDTWSEGFENGPDNGAWRRSATTGTVGWYWASEKPSTGLFASEGANNLWAVDSTAVTDTAIAMTLPVKVPANGFMRFEHLYEFEVTDGHLADGGVVEYSIDDGASWQDAGTLMANSGYTGAIDPGTTIPANERNPLRGRKAFVGATNGYTATRMDLSSLAGRSVRFRFRLGTDSGNGDADYAGWFVDRMRVYSCDPSPDIDPPAVEKFAPLGASDVNARKVTFRLSFTESVTGLDPSDFLIKGTSSGWAVASVTGSGPGPYTVELLGPRSTDGTLYLTLGLSAVSDLGGNVGPASGIEAAPRLRVDRVAPDTRISGGPTGGPRPTFQFTSPAPDVKSYQCRFGSEAWTACSSPFKRAKSLSKGRRRFEVRAIDGAGNTDPTPARRNFVV